MRNRYHLTLPALVILALLACTPSDGTSGGGGSETAEVAFEVIPDYLDDPYENASLGIAFRPPLGWDPLDTQQREQVADALVTEQDGDRYSLHLVDVFLTTDTLSFAALSRVTNAGESVSDREAFVEAFESGLGPANEEVRQRADFTVDGLSVTQFRHVVDDRIVFSLIFTANDGGVVKLDYSIPAAVYEDEGIKLESSIGTLRRITTEAE